MLAGFDGLPGARVAGILFDGERMGAGSDRLQVSGSILRSAGLARQLETPTGQRCPASAESDYAGDPPGLVPYRHYASLAAEYGRALKGAASMRGAVLEEQRALAHLAVLRDIEEKSPGRILWRVMVRQVRLGP